MFEDPRLDSLDWKDLSVCVDATGFMRPTLMFLLLFLNKQLGLNKYDVVYTEPSSYQQNENTIFSKETSGWVKSVEGYELASNRDHSRDLLIIGAGFDDVLAAEVAESKKHATKAQIIGFPSQKADMYQQNLFRMASVDELDSVDKAQVWFAPANDPFETANTIKRIVATKEKADGEPITNLFLSPLSTKAQTIGFALYYINECFNRESNASVVIPETMAYSDETSVGISDIWIYGLEFPENS